MTGTIFTSIGDQTQAELAGATAQTAAASPTAPASTSAYAMQGLSDGVSVITPKSTGIVLIIISGTVTSPAGTAAGLGVKYQISYGAGEGPANAAALAGTQVGPVQEYTNPATVTDTDVNVPFSVSAVVTGLTLGADYWVDLAAESVGTASDMGLSNVAITAVEM